MKQRILVSLALSAAIAIYGCGKQTPISPETTQSELARVALEAAQSEWASISQNMSQSQSLPSLAKKAVVAITIETWLENFVDQGKINVLPNGKVLILRQIMTGAVSGDLQNDAGDAITLKFSALQETLGDPYTWKFVDHEETQGPGWGRFVINANMGNLSGTFKGFFLGSYPDMSTPFPSKFKAVGTSGDFKGMRMKGTFGEYESPGDLPNIYRFIGNIYR